MEQLLCSIPDAAKLINGSRSKTYELIGEGKIEAVKDGRRQKVVVESLKRYVDTLRAKAAA